MRLQAPANNFATYPYTYPTELNMETYLVTVKPDNPQPQKSVPIESIQITFSTRADGTRTDGFIPALKRAAEEHADRKFSAYAPFTAVSAVEVEDED